MLRQRITLLNPSDSNDNVISAVDVSSITISPPVSFEREDKFTVEEVDLTFNHVGQLRIQMIKEKTRSKIFNFCYDRGLSIYASPRNITTAEDIEQFYGEVNGFIADLFQLDLNDKSWVASHNSLSYYTNDYSDAFTGFINEKLKYTELTSSKGIDWFYDGNKIIIKSISTVEKELVIKKNENISTEVGLFIDDEKISSRDDIVLSGVRAVFKEDTEDEFLFKTLFHVKPRHRQLDLKYNTNVVPNGLHPILQSKFDGSITYPEDSDLKECRLYYYLKLDKSLFLDKYQMSPDQKLLFRLGSSDLELPEYGIESWGNEILIELNSTSDTINLNLHSRYQKPNPQGNKKVAINDAHIFIGCDVGEDELLENSPFENRLSIGGEYERFFTSDTVFYHFKSQDDQLTVDIPSGASNAAGINNITLISIFLGIFLIATKLFKAFKKSTVVTKNKKND